MNFLSISTTQLRASLSYFREEENIISFDVSRHIAPSKWISQSIKLIENNFEDLFDTLNYIAVDIGPGSFTGIKVGLSFAQSIAISKNLFIVPVKSCAGLAFFGVEGYKIATITNAHRNLFYFALFEKDKNDLKEIYNVSSLTFDQILKELEKYDREKLCIITEKDIDHLFVERGKILITSNHNISFAVGELSKKFREEYRNISPENIEPLFIRQPDIKLKEK